MYIAIGIAAALFAADRILKYLSRMGKLKWERRYVRLTHLENRGFFLGLGQKHEKLLRWLPLGVWQRDGLSAIPPPKGQKTGAGVEPGGLHAYRRRGADRGRTGEGAYQEIKNRAIGPVFYFSL